MKNFDEILNKGTAKLIAEKEVAQQMVNSRVKMLRDFAKDIYEFVVYVNNAYPKYEYKTGSYYSPTIELMNVFEYNTSEMGNILYKVEFSVDVASKYASVYLVSHVLNDRIVLTCDENFRIKASVGYNEYEKHFNTANELIEYVAYLMAKRKLVKK